MASNARIARPCLSCRFHVRATHCSKRGDSPGWEIFSSYDRDSFLNQQRRCRPLIPHTGDTSQRKDHACSGWLDWPLADQHRAEPRASFGFEVDMGPIGRHSGERAGAASAQVGPPCLLTVRALSGRGSSHTASEAVLNLVRTVDAAGLASGNRPRKIATKNPSQRWSPTDNRRFHCTWDA